MAVVGEAIVRVHTVTAGMEKQLAADLRKAMKKAEVESTLRPRIDTKRAEQDAGVLAKSLAKARAKLLDIANSGGPVSSSLARIAGQLTEISPAAAAGAIGIGALLAVAFAGVGKFVALSAEIRKFKALSGTSAQEASRFVVALKALGVEPNKVATGLFRLSKEAENGGVNLRQYGVEVARTKEGNVDLIGTLFNVSDAMHEAGAGSKANAIAQAALSRAGRDLVPVLLKGSAALREYLRLADTKGLVFNDRDLTQAKDYQVSMRSLGLSAQALEISLGQGLVPALTALANGAITVVDAVTKATKGLGGLRFGVEAIIAVLAPEAIPFILVGEGLAYIGRNANKTTQELAQYSVAQKQANDAAAASKKSYQDLRGSLISYVQSQNSLRAANEAVADSQQAVRSAEQDLADLRRNHAIQRAREIADAEKGVENATRSVDRARKDLTKAEEELDQVRQGASARELARAEIRSEQATNSLASARKRLAQLQRGVLVSSEDLRDAQLAVRSAELDAADAQDELNDTQNKGKEGSPELAAALDRVTTAQDNYRQAVEEQADAERRLREARAPDLDYQRQLASAEDAVAKAKRGVRDALDQQRIAQLDFSKQSADFRANVQANYDQIEALRNGLIRLSQVAKIDLSKFIDLIPVGTEGATKAKIDQKNKETALNIYIYGDGTGSPTPSKRQGGKARGGNVKAGYWYRVNEEGTEYFRPDGDGNIYPVGSQQAMAASRGGATIHQYITPTGDPYTQAQLVGIETARAMRTASR